MQGWNNGGRLHLFRFAMRYSFLPIRYSLLLTAENSTLFELRCLFRLDERPHRSLRAPRSVLKQRCCRQISSQVPCWIDKKRPISWLWYGQPLPPVGRPDRASYKFRERSPQKISTGTIALKEVSFQDIPNLSFVDSRTGIVPIPRARSKNRANKPGERARVSERASGNFFRERFPYLRVAVISVGSSRR